MKIRSLLPALTALGGVIHVVDLAFAQSWVATSAPVTNWTGVACSADGIKLVAVSTTSSGGGGPIYTSADSGVTWTATSAPLHYWTCVASSSDRTRLIAGGGGRIYTSMDSGATWIESDSPGGFYSVASSSDGTKLFGASSYLYTLTPADGWLASDSPLYFPWTSIACSADGNRLIAGSQTYGTATIIDGTAITRDIPGSLWTSTDSGLTWQFQNVPLGNWSCVGSSADGSRLVGMGGGLAYRSEDSGTNWSKILVPVRTWTALASSADGTKLVAVASKQIFLSSDAGITWTNSGAPRADWTSVASSADGSKVVAVAGGNNAVGRIYTWRAALPALSITLSANTALISWPASATGFGLQENPDLNSKNWTDLTSTPTVTNQQNQLMVSTSNSARFYRLNRP
ncbi:MAG: sialidase family protein [Verrucomicrobiota bacterium]